MGWPTIMGKSPGEVCTKTGLAGIVAFSVPTALTGLVPIYSLNTLIFIFFLLLSTFGIYEWKRERKYLEETEKLTNDTIRLENKLREVELERQKLEWRLEAPKKINKKKSEDVNRAKLLKPLMELAEKTGEKKEADLEVLIEEIKKRILESE